MVRETFFNEPIAKDSAVNYIHVHNDELDKYSPRPPTGPQEIMSALPKPRTEYENLTNSNSNSLLDSGMFTGSDRSNSSEERSLGRTDSSNSEAPSSKRSSKISDSDSFQNHLDIYVTQNNHATSPSHSPSSGSLASPETCDETGTLLCKTEEERGQGDRIPIVVHKDFSPSQHYSERKRNNSKSDRLSRIRHASYDGPASPKIKDREEDLEMGHFQKVIENSDSSSNGSVEVDIKDEGLCGTFVSVCALIILLLANLLNYMDRYTIAGVLPAVQDYYQITDAQAGLLQTSFIIFYMLFSPLFGYLGDRFNRKWLMAVGIFLWSLITFAGSFIPADRFGWFVLMRGMVGIGEASYSTIAPTIIADMFSKDSRTKALAVFYFAIPVGSGLGYIVGAWVAAAFGAWQWALRVTPPLGIVCSILIVAVVREPERGASDGAHDLHKSASLRGWFDDLKQLCCNKSFMLSTFGFTCVAFVAGALAFWAPTYVIHSIQAQGHTASSKNVSLVFGVITCLAGLIGVIAGSESARRLRPYCKRADPLVCAFGLIMCAPFLFLALVVSRYNTVATWVLIFFGETFLCLNWAIVTDILLYTVVPNVRSSAEAMQILLSHLLGDAGSPYLIGVISDTIKAGSEDSAATEYISLQYALYCTAFVCVIGGGFFLATSIYVVQDRKKAELACKVNTQGNGAITVVAAPEVPAINSVNGDYLTEARA